MGRWRSSSLPTELIQFIGQQIGGTVMDEFRRRRAARNEPRAKLERQRLATLRWVWFLLSVLVICGSVGAVALTGQSDVIMAVLAAVAVLVSGVLIARDLLRLRGLDRQLAITPRTRARGSDPPYRLPPLSSKARQPLQSLAAAELSLGDLLEQLLPGLGTGSIPLNSITQTRETADNAAVELRRLAAQLRAVERARDAAHAEHRATLDDAVRAMRGQLDEGVEAYGRLVTAAGQTVAASAVPNPGRILAGSRQSLTEATDHLAGLAAALSELSHQHRD